MKGFEITYKKNLLTIADGIDEIGPYLSIIISHGTVLKKERHMNWEAEDEIIITDWSDYFTIKDYIFNTKLIEKDGLLEEYKQCYDKVMKFIPDDDDFSEGDTHDISGIQDALKNLEKYKDYILKASEDIVFKKIPEDYD